MTPNAPSAADVWATIQSMQDSIEHTRDDVARLAAAVAMVLPASVLGSADERWARSPTARHLDHVCDHLVLAVRTLTEIQRRTSDAALRELCQNALDRMVRVKGGVLAAA
jgi:hypothetical protein